MILTKLPFMSFPAHQQLSIVFYYFAIYCLHLLQAQSIVKSGGKRKHLVPKHKCPAIPLSPARGERTCKRETSFLFLLGVCHPMPTLCVCTITWLHTYSPI